ncbi:MAG: hypothetical protein ACLTXL_14240 [Clostridia bacterium]
MELTGRENVTLTGVIGYTERHHEKYSDIVKFAELEGFMRKVNTIWDGIETGFAIATVEIL